MLHKEIELLPNFLIIGAQKAGSTFIHRCVKQHPEVFIPTQEVPFFEDPDYQQHDLSDLESLFDSSGQKRVLGIKRPSYLGKPECPSRIHRHIPNARLIVIVRNPVDRAISAYFHQMKNGVLPIKPADKGIDNLLKGQYKTSYPRSCQIIEFGFYFKHLARYLEFFDRDQILILLQDDLKSNPTQLVKQTYRFLDIDDSYVPSGMNSHVNTGIYSINRLKFRVMRNHFIFEYNADRTRLQVKQQNKVESFFAKAIDTIDRRVLTRFTQNVPPQLSATSLSRLYEVYRDDISQLEILLKRDLSSWKPLRITE